MVGCSSSSSPGSSSSTPNSSNESTPNHSPMRRAGDTGRLNQSSWTTNPSSSTSTNTSMISHNNQRRGHLFTSVARSSSACRPPVSAAAKRASAQYRSQHNSVTGPGQREKSVDNISGSGGLTCGRSVTSSQGLVSTSAYTSNSASTDNITDGSAGGGTSNTSKSCAPNRDRARPPIASEPQIPQNISATIQQQKAMKQISGLSAVKTQVCKSCHKFLKHVLHTNTSTNYFCGIQS